MVASKGRALFLAILLVVGTALTAALGGWVLGHPLKPIEKTVYVQTPCAVCPVCPPSKTGAASTKGNQSPASTGSGNTVTYGTPPKGSPQQ